MRARIYLAGPLFTLAERNFNSMLAEILRAKGHEIFLPQEQQQQEARQIYDNDIDGLDWCNIVVANMDGADPDSGTCWECGAVYQRKPYVLYRTDIREENPFGPYNLMLHQSADQVLDCRHDNLDQIADKIDSAVIFAITSAEWRLDMDRVCVI